MNISKLTLNKLLMETKMNSYHRQRFSAFSMASMIVIVFNLLCYSNLYASDNEDEKDLNRG